MVNRKVVALFVVLAAIPAIAAWSQYPSAKGVPVVDAPVLREASVTPPTFSVTQEVPVVVLAKKAPRKVSRVATVAYPKRDWHSMEQGPVSRQVRDL